MGIGMVLLFALLLAFVGVVPAWPHDWWRATRAGRAPVPRKRSRPAILRTAPSVWEGEGGNAAPRSTT